MDPVSLDLEGKQFGFVGKKDMGKSFLMNFIMANLERQGKTYACFDPMQEHTDYSDGDLVMRPTARRGDDAVRQLDEFVEFVVSNRSQFDYIFVDELNRFQSKHGELDGPIGDLCDFSAHYNMGFGWVARRPVQVHTDVQELSDYMFVFHLSGSNDIRKLDNTAVGLGERAAALSPKEFILVEPKGYTQHPPISANLDHHKGL